MAVHNVRTGEKHGANVFIGQIRGEVKSEELTVKVLSSDCRGIEVPEVYRFRNHVRSPIHEVDAVTAWLFTLNPLLPTPRRETTPGSLS